MKEYDKCCVEEGFQFARENLTKKVKEAMKLQMWRIVVSILEIDQNRNKLGSRKAVYILKKSLLSGISKTLIFKVREVLQ